MKASGELRASDAVLTWDATSLKLRRVRPVPYASIVAGLFFLGSIAFASLDMGPLAGAFLYLPGGVAILVMTLLGIDEGARARIDRLVVGPLEAAGYRARSEASVQIDGTTTEAGEIRSVSVRRRVIADRHASRTWAILTLEHGDRARPLAAFADLSAAREAQAILVARLGVPASDETDEPRVGGCAAQVALIVLILLFALGLVLGVVVISEPQQYFDVPRDEAGAAWLVTSVWGATAVVALGLRMLLTMLARVR